MSGSEEIMSRLLTVMASDAVTLIVLLASIAMLIPKEIISGLRSEGARRLSRRLDIALVPLILALVATMAAKVAHLLHL